LPTSAQVHAFLVSVISSVHLGACVGRISHTLQLLK